MAQNIKLPNGALFPLKEGETPEQALAVARQMYPDAFAAPQPQGPAKDTTGFKAAVGASAERLGGEFELLKGKLGLKDQAEAQREFEAAQVRAAARFTPTEKGWTEDPLLKFKETLGGSVPYMVAPAAAGLAALAAPVSVPVAAGLGLVGAGAVSAGQFTGSNLAAQLDTGKTLEQASLGKAVSAAVPQALLDTAAMALLPGVGKLFGSVGARLTTEQAKAIASQTLGRTLADYAAKTGAAMGREGVTEATQQLLERLQAGLNIADPEARAEYVESFIGGAVLAGAGAPIGRAFERSGAKRQAEEAIRKEQADAAAKAAAEEEAAKTTPEALRALEASYKTAEQQLAALNAQVGAAKPAKNAPADAKQAYEELKKARAEFVNGTFKPLKQEYDKRKGAIAQMYDQQMAAAEMAAAPTQQAAVAPIPNAEPQRDVQRLMDEQITLRNQLDALEGRLAQAAPEQFDALNAQRQELQRRIDARATLIEEMGGTPLRAAEFEQATAAKMQAIDTRLEKLNAAYATALENRDYDKAADAKDQLLIAKQEREALTAKTAQQMQALQTQQMAAQQRGQTLDMFPEAPAAPTTTVDDQIKQQTLEEEKDRALYGPEAKRASAEQAFSEAQIGPRGQLEPITPMPELKVEEAVQDKQVEAFEAASDTVRAAEAALAEAVKTKDTPTLYAAIDKLNEAANAQTRAQKTIGQRPVAPSEPFMLDIFSPANIINTAINNNDTKLISDLARHADTTALREALDANKTERERLTNVLESRLDLGGTDKAKATGEPLRSVKRERADLFSKLYDSDQRASFTNGTNQEVIKRPRTELVQVFQKDKRGNTVLGPDGKPVVVKQYEKPVLDKSGRPVVDVVRLQDVYDKGGPAAVEYEKVMQAVEELSKKVTTKQGNAKESLYERAVRQYAALEELKAQQESGIATPTLREKTAALRAKQGKGEAPAPRQMDASEKYQLRRKIDAAQNAYSATIGQITPIRDEILALYNSLYTTTPLEKPSVVAERKERESRVYRTEVEQGAKPFLAAIEKISEPSTGEKGLRQIGNIEVDLQPDKYDENTVYFGLIRALKGADKGEASTVLKQITDLADRHGVTLLLQVEKVGKKGLNEQQLEDWYAKNGFKRGDMGMYRKPQPVQVQKVAVSRTARTAARLARGDVRKEAETSQQLRDLAESLGMKDPEFDKFGNALLKRVQALKNRYGNNDPATIKARAGMVDALKAKAIELGKKTPEYKAALKEQIEYFKEVLPTAGKQTVPTKRTGQVTRRQSAAPKRLVTSSPESRAQSEAEALRAKRTTFKDFKEALAAESQEREDERFLRGVETESVALSAPTVKKLEQGDLRGALTDVSNDKRVDDFSRAVAKRLLDFLDATNVRVVDVLTDPDGKPVLGAATSKLVEISRDGGLSVETLLHEATHAAAERVVQLAETAPDKLTKEQKLAINELKAIHARVKADPKITSTNAKSSLSEFVAEVMSNRNLQKQLAQQKWRMSDMWQGVKSVIMRMLGLDKVETMFGASVVAVEQLFVPSSVRNLGGKAEVKVTRNLSAKDIAALHDGTNSMKQFADQFGPLIKQKDRTPEDVERIAMQAIQDMGKDLDKTLSVPTADTLDYKAMATMSDGKLYDENNPLHYVEATPATFAALQAMEDPWLRKREADTVAQQRKDDFTSLAQFFSDNYTNYTLAETALVLKAASKYAVLSGKDGKLRLAELAPNNRHNVAVVGKEDADAVIEQLRAGKNLKQAFLDGLQKNADDNAKNNERKNGWKKFDQVAPSKTDDLVSRYTDEEVNNALGQTGYDGGEFADDTELVEQLIQDGLLEDRRKPSSGNLEAAAIELNAGCAGTPWCTGASVGTARSQIAEGDFYVYYKNGRPEVAVRMDGTGKIGEVRGNNPNQALDPEQQKIAANFLRANKFERVDEYLSEFERREALVKLAKGEAKLSVTDLLGEKSPLDSDGEVDAFEVSRLLKFRTIDGYGIRPKPVDSVVDFFGKQYLDAATRAYENNEFVFSNIRVDETTARKGIAVKFAGKEYTATTDSLKAVKEITLSVYSYSRKPAEAVTFPNLKDVQDLDIFSGELVLPSLKTVSEVTFFRSESNGARAKIVLPPNATVKEVHGYGDSAGVIEGPTTIELVTLAQKTGSLTLELPDTKYVATAVDTRGISSGYARSAVEAVNDALEAKGVDYTNREQIMRGEGTPAQTATFEATAKLAVSKFFKALEKEFGVETVEQTLNSTDIAEVDYKTAFREVISDVLAANNYSREAFDKMAKVIKAATGADVTYPEGQLVAPKRVGNPPYEQAFTEAPEERRFAPKDVGVQGDEKKGFSFLRKKPQADSVVGRELGVVDTLLGNILGLAGRVQFIDQYAALEASIRKGLDAGVISDLEATNANYLLRFGQQRSQFAGQFMTNGPVRAEITKKAGGVETVYRSTKGVTLVDVAQELNKAKLGDDIEQENMFTVYLAGKRANQVGWDKLNFKDPAKARAEYDTVISRLNGSPEAKKAFEEAAKLYQEYNAGLLDFLVQTGALSAKKAAELKSISYVPFYRINGNGEVQLMIDKEHPVRIASIKDQPQLKELIGGNTAILPIFTSAAQNTFMLTGMGLRNQAVKETAFMLRKLGIADRIGQGMGPAGQNVVRFFKNGEPHHVVIDNDAFGIPAELIVRGMEGIKTTLPAVMKLLALPADILRSFVVRNPAYAIRQMIRDPLNAWMITGTDAVPVLSSMKELAKMVAGRSDAERKLMETGAVSSNVYSGDERDMAMFMRDISAGKPFWAKAVAKLDTFAMQGDASTRAVVYKDSLAKGMSEQEALLRTLESMNFSRRGVSPSMHALSVMIPFFNAQIQGLDVIYRAFKGDMPYSKQLEIRAKMARRGVLIAAGTLAYAAMMEDDEAYQRAKPEERYSSWFVYVPGFDEPVRVPIPFEMGFLFKALPEAVWNVAMQDEKADKALSGIGKLAMQTVPLSMPQAIKPLTEAVLGKSFYSGDIESLREKDVDATQRYRENTTEVAKTIGAVTGKVGLSPITIDHLIRGYTAGLGIALVQLANPLLASDAKAAVEKPTTKDSKLPIIGNLFQPVEGRGTLDEAYARMTEIRQAKGTYNKMVEEGRRAEAQAYAQAYANKLAAISISGSVQKRLGDLAAVERQIRSSPTMTTAEKDAKLAQIDKMKTALAKQFLAATD